MREGVKGKEMKGSEEDDDEEGDEEGDEGGGKGKE